MEHPPLDLLTQRSFPELAAALRQCAGRVLERWERRVRELLPTADELTLSQLRDNLPGALHGMADALAADQPAPTDELISSSSEHGAARFHHNYSVAEVLTEYHLLRRVVVEEVATQLARPLKTDEIVVLNQGVDASVRQAVIAFVDYQTGELKTATEAQSKYLSFLSHDLRGGLNGIFLMIEVLKRELGGDPKYAETIEDLDAMRRQLLETVATMDRFLYAERFRKGKVKLKPGAVRLDSLLNEVSAQFAYQARDKHVEIKVAAPAATGVTSDRELLTLILQNLVSNAVKYTAKRTTVGIAARPATDRGGGWYLEVSDQGPGIAREKLATLFDSFTRGDTHGQPGVGLGLTIAHQAAQVLGAKLWAEANAGPGTTFRVHLPEAVKGPQAAVM
jgi:signal transduction histidine kinase